MVLYMISFFQMPKGVLNKVDYFRSRFFWQGDSEKKKYRLARWNVVCRLKEFGGLGIHDMQVKNTALLGKWLFKLLTEDGVWQTMLWRNMWGPRLCLKWFGNPVIHIFGRVLWPPRSISFVLVLSRLRMDHRLGFGKIDGLAILLFANNIRLYIRLLDIKGIQFPRCWKSILLMCLLEEVSSVLDWYLGTIYYYDYPEYNYRMVLMCSNGNY